MWGWKDICKHKTSYSEVHTKAYVYNLKYHAETESKGQVDVYTAHIYSIQSPLEVDINSYTPTQIYVL